MKQFSDQPPFWIRIFFFVLKRFGSRFWPRFTHHEYIIRSPQGFWPCSYTAHMDFHPSPPPIANRAYSAQPDEVTHTYAHNAVQLHSPGLNHCDSRHNRNNTPNSCSTVIHHSSHQEIKTSLFHPYVMAKIPEVTQY